MRYGNRFALYISLTLVTLFILTVIGFSFSREKLGGETLLALGRNSIWTVVIENIGRTYTVYPITHSRHVFVDVQEIGDALLSEVKLNWKDRIIEFKLGKELLEKLKSELQLEQTGKSQKAGNSQKPATTLAYTNLIPGQPLRMKDVHKLMILPVLNEVKPATSKSTVYADGEKILSEMLSEKAFKSNEFLIVPTKVKTYEFSPQAVWELVKEEKPEVKPDAVLFGRLTRYEYRTEQRELFTLLVEVQAEVGLIETKTGRLIWYNCYRLEDTNFAAYNNTVSRRKKLLKLLLDKISTSVIDSLVGYKHLDATY